MAIKSVYKTFKGRSASGTMDDRTYVEFYDVLVDDPLADTPEDARRAKGALLGTTPPSLDVPDIGAPLDMDGTTDPNRLCSSVVATQDESNPTLYRVEVQYSTINEERVLPKEIEQPQGGGNPLREPDKVSIGWEARREQVNEARVMYSAGDPPTTPPAYEAELIPLTSAAGEPFDPPVEKDAYDLVIVYVRNEELDPTQADETKFSIQKCLDYQGKTNEDQWFGIRAGEARMELTAERQYGGGMEYWIVTYRIVIRLTRHPHFPTSEAIQDFIGWDTVLINQGTRQLVKLSEAIPQIKVVAPIYEDEVDWEPTTQTELTAGNEQIRTPATMPHKLDENGKVIPPNTSTGLITPTDYVPRTRVADPVNGFPAGSPSSWEVYERIPFAPLELELPTVTP